VEGWLGRRTWVVDFTATTYPLVRALRPLLPDGRVAAAADDALLVGWALAVGAVAVTGWRRAPGAATRGRGGRPAPPPA
jgi:hypothetical protein